MKFTNILSVAATVFSLSASAEVTVKGTCEDNGIVFKDASPAGFWFDVSFPQINGTLRLDCRNSKFPGEICSNANYSYDTIRDVITVQLDDASSEIYSECEF